MKHRIVKLILVSLAIGMIGGLARAADAPPANKGRTAAVPQAAVVDINSASRQELKKLPGIGNAEADRIIAGRPYLTKAHLQTREIVSPLVYQGLRDLVVARQKDARFAKVAGK